MSFRTVLMDPPWPEHGGGKCKRGADRHYPLVSLREMPYVIQGAPEFREIADDAHCYMWVTNNYLMVGGRLLGDLGFRYVTNLCWVKDRSGLGQYWRGQHELCLFGVRGDGYDVRTARKDLATVIGSPRGKHSAKPEEFHALVEARSEGPYLELFARTVRPGWTCWGNEVAA